MPPNVDDQSERRSYRAFLEAKVMAARADIRTGRWHGNDEVEADISGRWRTVHIVDIGHGAHLKD